MTSNQNPTRNENNKNIRGEPLPLDELLAFAEIDELDVEFAAEWWDKHASPEWRGALDEPPVEDGQ